MAAPAQLLLGWMKWIGLIAGMVGFGICALMMIIGRRNRSSMRTSLPPAFAISLRILPACRRSRIASTDVPWKCNLISAAGLVPVMELAEQTGLSALLDEHVHFGCEPVKADAASATAKLTAIIAGMAAGADSIDDLDVVRAGGRKQVFTGVYAAATLGILLREFTFGHASQLAAVLRRHLLALTARTSVLDGIEQQAYVDIDSLLRPVYGHAKQGACHWPR